MNATSDVAQDVNSLVDVDLNWFLSINVTLMMFALTLVVHINCLFNAVALLRSRTNTLLSLVYLVPFAEAVACHLTIITDYLFVTNCQIKPIHVYTQYTVSTTVMGQLMPFWIILALKLMTDKLSVLLPVCIVLCLSVAPVPLKLFTYIDLMTTMKGVVSNYNICKIDMDPLKFFRALKWEIVIHTICLLVVLFTLSLLMGLKVKGVQRVPLTKQKHQFIIKNLLIILLVNVTVLICFTGMVTLNLPNNLNDILFHLKWAIQFKGLVTICELYFDLVNYKDEDNLDSTDKELEFDNTLVDKIELIKKVDEEDVVYSLK